MGREESYNQGLTKQLRGICDGLLEEGVSRENLEKCCNRSRYLGLPGSFGHRYSQVMKTALVAGMGCLGAYIGHKMFSDSSIMPEVFGGLSGLVVGLCGSVYSEAEEPTLMETLIEKFPGELKRVYLRKGFSPSEVKEIFELNRHDARLEVYSAP